MTLAALTVASVNASASDEEKSEKDWSKGYVTGSFETNTNLYHEDARSSATVPDGKFGSNNYLKLDYCAASPFIRTEERTVL